MGKMVQNALNMMSKLRSLRSSFLPIFAFLSTVALVSSPSPGYAQCTSSEVEVVLEVSAGSSQFPGDIFWDFKNVTQGSTVDSTNCGFYINSNTTSDTFCLDSTERYKFRAMDDFGDGWGSGSYYTLYYAASGDTINYVQNPDLSLSNVSKCRGSKVEDTFAFSPSPCPFIPENLKVDQTLLNQASLSWDGSSPTGNAFVVSYREKGTPFSNNSDTVTNNVSLTLNALDTNTQYLAYVREICGGSGDSTDYVGPVEFCTNDTLNYTQNFNSGFPGCWKRNSSSDVTTLGCAGSDALAVEKSGRAISQGIDASNASNVKVFFQYRLGGNGCGMAPSGSENLLVEFFNGSNWESLTTYSPGSAPATFTNDSFYVTGNDVNNDLKVRFTKTGSGSGTWVIENFKLNAVSCPPSKNLALNSKDTNDIEVGWNARTANSFNVVKASRGGAPSMGQSSVTSNTSYSFTGLQDDKAFDLYVQEICSPRDTSKVIGPLQACTKATLPYVETFDSDYPACFSRSDKNDVTTSNACGAGYTLRLDNNGKAVTNDVNIGNAANLKISYEVRHGTSGCGTTPAGDDSLAIEYWDGSGWATLESYQPGGIGNFTNDSVYLTGGFTSNFKIRVSKPAGGNGSWFLDDLAVSESCPPVTQLNLDSVNTNYAQINWNGRIANNWDVEYGQAGFALGNGSVQNTNDTFYDITGLMPGTQYDAYVTENCTGSSGETQGPVTFCTRYEVPIDETFDNGIPTCFEVSDDGDVNVEGNCGSKKNVVSITDEATLATGRINARNKSNLKVAYTIGGGICGNNPEPDEVLNIEYWNGSAWVKGSSKAGTFGYTSDSFYVEPSALSAEFQVRFKMVGGTTDKFYVDDLRIEEVSCPAPKEIEVISKSFDQVTLSVKPQNASALKFELGKEGFSLGTGQYKTTNDTFLTFTGLTPETEYDAYSATICGASDTSQEIKINFSTRCKPFDVPLVENFDSASRGWQIGSGGNNNSGDGFNRCWERDPSEASELRWSIGSGSTPSNFSGPESDHTTGNGNYLFMESSQGNLTENAYMTLPPIDLTGGKDPNIQFYYHMSGFFAGDGEIMLQASTDNGENWDTLFAKEGPQSPNWQEAVVDLNQYSNKTVLLRFEGIRNTQYNDYAIDDIRILQHDFVAESYVGPKQPCNLTANENVIASVKYTGLDTLNNGAGSVDVTYVKNGGSPVTESFDIDNQLTNGDILTDTFAATTDLSQDNTFYGFQIWTNGGFDETNLNDTSRDRFRRGFDPPMPTAQDDSVCRGKPGTLHVSNPDSIATYSWYNEPLASSANLIKRDTIITRSNLQSNDTLYVGRKDSVGKKVMLTELNKGNPDGIEVTNIVNSAKDFKGYTLAVNEEDIINSVSQTWDFSKTFSPQEAIYVDEDEEIGSLGHFGNDGMWAMIVDPNGNVVDFAAVDFSQSQLNSLNVTVNGFNITYSDVSWIGGGKNSGVEEYVREGSSDNDNSSDWVSGKHTPDQVNQNLNLSGFSSGTCLSDLQEVVIYVQPVPNAGFAAPKSVCAKSTLQFNDTTSYLGNNSNLSYSWNFGGNDTSQVKNPSYAFPQSEGQFQVEEVVESDFGCVDTVVNPVNVNAVPEAGFSSIEACADKQIQLRDSTTFPGFGDLNYQWTVQNSTYQSVNPVHTFSASATNEVELAVTSDKGCTDTVTQQADILPTPDVQYSVSDACAGDQVQFNDNTAFAGSISNLNYNWSFGDRSGSNNPLATHTYDTLGDYNTRLIVRSADGCVDTANRQVTINGLPDPDFTFENTCDPKAVDLTNTTKFGGDAANLDYTWDLEGNSVNVEEATYTFSNAQTYQVELEATNTNGNCVNTITQDVDVKPQPTADFSVSDVCVGEEANFDYTGNNPAPSYNWDLATTTSTMENPAVTYDQPGSYDVSLTVNYYDGECVKDTTQTLAVNPVPTADFAFGTKGPVCAGEEVQFVNNTTFENGDANTLTYDWAVGSTGLSGESPVFPFDNEGTFDVELTARSTEGCESTFSLTKVVNPLPVSDFTLDKVGPDEVSLSAQDNTYLDYKYTLDDSAKVTQPFVNYTFDSNGTYNITLMVEDRAGCTSSTSDTFTIETVGFGDQPEATNSKIEAYPNPFQDVARINYSVKQQADVQLEVYTANGQNLVTETYNDRPAGSYSFNLKVDRSLPTGATYLIRLQIGDKVYTKELIQQR